MDQERNAVTELVVEVDARTVAQGRTIVLRSRRTSAWTTSIAAGIITGLGVGGALTLPANWLVMLMIAFPGLLLALDAGRQFAATRRLRETWQRAGIPAVAMRISAAGLHCSNEAAPAVFLPWPAVAGIHLKRRLGQPMLVLELAPGTTAATPGVVGLDHPDVQRALRTKTLGVRGLWFGVRSLRQPLEEIDRAFAHFTNGRVRCLP
ncbi:hypothetical protein AB0I53_30070 [Saccharopolyspora sp. NPDC050389]|uniref:hypothetical protein n=1 Tax=Saccharopolyspora sp. NPDC050389 TaxID=3155516 RepID=UPI0033E72719